VLVRDCMEQELVTVRPRMDVLEALRLMRERGVSRVLVVDDHGGLLGMVTKTRALEALCGSQQQVVAAAAVKITANIIMEPCPTPVSPDYPLELALRLMVESGHGSLPVVSSSGLVGIICRQDIIGGIAAAEG